MGVGWNEKYKKVTKMKLSKCTIGVLAKKEGEIGHVVGLTRNMLHRIHHSNIELYKG